MKLTAEEKYEIAQMTAEILKKQSQPKINRNWLHLRKEIETYCRENSTNVRFTTLQSKIYEAIRAVLSISRIDDMSENQVIEARRVFEFIKQERLRRY